MRIAPLAAGALVLALASEAHALPVDWSGSWAVDGETTPHVVEERLAGQLALITSVPVEGSTRQVEITGSASEKGLALDSTWVDGLGLVGFLENVKLAKKHSVSLRATAETRDTEVVAQVVTSVDGREVKRETWRARSSLELVGLEVGGKPLAGDYDPVLAGSLLVRFRVVRGSLPVHARVEVGANHPYPYYYTGSTLFEQDLGALDPGEHEVVWDGRDRTRARRIALGGPYRLVLEPSRPRAPAPRSDDSGLPPPSSEVSVPGAVSSCFKVAAPRMELVCSDWPANFNDVKQPRWNESDGLASIAGLLAKTPTGDPSYAFAGPRVLQDTIAFAKYLKQSAFTLLETHGNTDLVALFNGDPSKPWQKGDWSEDRITGRYFDPGDLKDVHFVILDICDGAVRDENGRSFVSSLREAGCDVAIGFNATIAIAEGRRFRDLVFGMISAGTPVEKAARDAALVTYRQDHQQETSFLFFQTGRRDPTDAEMDAMIDKERKTPADPNVNHGIKSLASSIVVERGNGISADESMWPPRYGDSTNGP
jgi:hypothetical protein